MSNPSTVTINVTTGMQCYLNQLLAEGLDGTTIGEICERLVCQALVIRTGATKKRLINASSWTHMESISQAAATTFNVTHDEVVGRNRTADVVGARHAAMYAAMQTRRYSFVRIAQYFKCDHSSVLHACNKIRDHMSRDAALKRDVEQLMEVACA